MKRKVVGCVSRSQFISELLPVFISLEPLESIYMKWIVNKLLFVSRVIENVGDFPTKILVSRKTFLFIYCYTKAFGNFTGGNWFDFSLIVDYDNFLFDNEVVMLNDADEILCMTKEMRRVDAEIWE